MSMLSTVKRLLPERHPLRLFWHRIKAWLAARRAGFPARRLKIIAITGTDGKTTTVAMTAHVLHRAGVKVGAVSTSFFRILDAIEENPTHKTSLSPAAFQNFLRRCADAGCTHVVVEASSHGLVQHRLDHLWPSIAAITNTSAEHLDYHGSMEQYRRDKGILFQMLKPDGVAVLNADDETLSMYSTYPARLRIAYSSHRACDLRATDIRESPDGTHARIIGKDGSSDLRLTIPGRFNVDNALCAIACANAAGIPMDTAVAALETFPGVAGRMERIDEGQPFAVYVDFTVTPAAYEKTLSSLKKTLAPGKKLLVLTGSCGNRMREKRPEIGAICSRLADVVVVTEDETITEDPLNVIEEVWSGVDASATDGHKIPDRKNAIRFLLQAARPGDAVALCGMGACSTMQTLDGLRPWDEREIAREILRQTK